MSRRVASLAAAVALFACDKAPAEPALGAVSASASPSSSATTASVAAPAVQFDVFVTAGAGEADELPMIVALHGLGDNPSSFRSVIASFPEPARIAVGRGLDAYGKGYSWFGPAPGKPRPGLTSAETGEGIARAVDAVAAGLAKLTKKHPTRGKPVVFGFSQGGALSYGLALRHPHAISAAFPISGWLPTSVERPLEVKAEVTVRALHGEDDNRVPLALGREATARLAALGYDAQLQRFPNVGHTLPNEMRQSLTDALASALP